MKKSILVLILLLSTGIAFSQTTVTLQDQCNCEVLKGTDVSSPGAIVPSGADTGDIYVNTNTGTIYFWDGDTWELTSTDAQQLTGFTFNDATNTLTLTLENGGSVNVDLSSLSDSLTDTNTTITSFGIDGTNTNLVITDSDTNTYAVSLADIAALIDTDNQTLSEVLSEGNSAGTSITNVTDPTNAQDAATKNYVDTQITANAADGSETIVNAGTDISVSGTGTTGDPYVVSSTFTEVDGSITNEIQDLASVLGEGNSAGTSITNVTDPTNAQDAATKNYVDTQITANAADGSETIVNAGTDISVSGTGTTGDPYVVNSTFTEVDGSITNEIQNLASVLGEGNSAGTSITNVTDPTNAQDAATKNYVDTQITANAADGSETIVNAGTDISVSGTGTTGDPYVVNSTFTEVDGSITNEIQNLASVLGEGNSAGTSITNVTDPTNAQDAATKNYVDTQITANAADGSETVVNAGTDISVSGSGTTGDPYIVNNTFTEVDGSITNEINTRFEVSGANLEIEDSNGTLQVPLTNLGSDDQTLSEVLSEGNSAGTSITNVTDPTNAQDAATKNYVDTQITANAADGSETIVNAGTDISVSGTGTTGDPYIVNSTFTEVDGSITNEINTRFEVSGANLEIEDGNGTLQVPLANLGSDDQTLSEVLSEGNSAGTSITNVTDPTNAQDAATKNYVDTQITANAADGSETVVNAGTDISVSGSGTTGDPYIVNNTFTEVDGSITNEINTRFEVSGANLEIEDSNGTLQVPLTNLGSDDQTLSEVLSEGNSAGTSITNVTDPTNAQDAATKNYVDTQITANAADGSETIVNAGTDISVSGTGTTGDPYIVNSTFTEVDGSITNEIQDLASVLGEGNSAGTSITNVTDPTNAQDAATKNYVDTQITANAADGSETIVNAGTDISVSGTGTTGDPYVVNSTFTESQEAIDIPYDPSTTTLTSGNVQNVIEELKAEVDAFAATSGQTNTASNVGTGGVGTFARKTGADLEFKNINAGSNKITITDDVANDEIDIDINEANITITESQISDLSHTVDTDDQTLSEVLSEGNSAGTSITNVTDPTNAQDAATKNYVDTQITANAADGSETIVNAGTDISVSGTGTTGDPYVVNNAFTEVDGSITNEINTRFEVSGANLEIEDGNGTLQVPLANLGSDDQTLSEVLSEGNSAGTSITNVTDPTNAQDAATKNYVDSQITANAADGSETIVNAGTDISVSGSGTTGDPYIVNSTFTEVDGSITNEINTRFEVSGANLEIEDGNGTLQVPLANLGSDDQTLSEVLSEGNSAGTSITNVTDPTNAQDAATKNYVDTQITANTADGSETIVNAGTDISVSGTGTTGDPYIVNSTFTEVDGSITNEIQDLASVLGEGNSAGTSITNVTDPTNAQDAATKNYVDTQITANAADGSETIVNAGTDISVSGTGTTGDPYVVNSTFTEVDGSITNEIQDLASVLGEGNSAGTSITNVTDPTNAQDAATKNYVDTQITANAADGSETIVNAGTDISVSGTGTTGDPYVVNSTFTEVDGSITNEIQNLASVLGEGNSAGTSITNVTDPTNAQDAATKNYVDTQITANAADGSETIVNAGTDISVSGTGTTGDPYIVNSTFTEVDGSVTNEIQNLASVLGEGNSAGTSITNVTDPTNAQDAATKNYVDTQITANAADGSETIVNAGTDISVSGSGTTGDPYIVNSTFTEVDGSITNEIQDLASVLGEGNSAGTSITNVTDPTNAQDAATKNYVDTQITANAADGSETIVNAGTDISVSGTGTTGDPYVVNSTFTEVDGSVTNEINTRFEVSGANLEIEDSNGTLQVPLANLGSDDQTLSEVLSEGNSAGTSITNVTDPINAQDAATKNYVDTQITANAADGSETIVNAGTDISVSGTGTTGDPYIVNSTFTEVDGSITNEIQNLASVLGEGNSAGTSITNVTDPTNAQDAATKNYVDTQITANAADGSETIVNAGTDISVSGTGTTGDPYIVNSTFTEVDGSVTNEINTRFEVSGANLEIEDSNGTLQVPLANLGSDDQTLSEVLSEGNSAGTSITNVTDPTNAQDAATKNYVDTQITANAADGSETIVNAGTDISVSGTGTTGDPYIVNSTFTEVDGSITNEIQNLASVLGEGNSAGTSITNVTDPTNAQDAATKNYVDTQITANAADGSETIVNAGTDISVSGTGTTGDPYIVNSTFTEVDGSVTNEINTRFEVSGANLEIEDSNGTLQVPLANLGSDDQTLSEVLSEGNSAGTSITNVTDPTNAQDAATKNYVDTQITANAADGSETIVNAGTDISVSGTGTTGDPYIVNSTFTEVDGSVTNEINTRFEVNGANLEIEDGNGTLQVPLANLGSDDQTLSEVLSEGNSAGTSITNVTDPTNAQDAATKNYVDTQITANAADGSETIVNAGTDISVSGTGTTGDPYIVNSTFTEVDGSITNEIQDLASVLGEGNSAGTSITNVTDPTNAQDAATKNYVDTQITANAADGSETIVNAGTDISVSGTGTTGDPYIVNSTFTEVDGSITNEIQDLASVLGEGNSAGTSITNVTDPTNAQDAATKNYVDTQITANAADGSETIVNAGTDISVSGTGTTGDPYIVNSTFVEVDGSVTNEINTRFEVSGANLEIEDSNGTLQVALADINIDQTASDVDLDTSVDSDGDGSSETTVEGAIQAMSPIVSKAARIFYPPSIAVDASTNGVGRTLNLYNQYVAQFGTPAVASLGAPAAIPTYGATDLYYYVTYADPAVFDNMSIDASGELTYDIIGQPSDYNALINVVFVVK